MYLGGSNFTEGGPPIGTVYAPNLTPGGHLNDWSDGEIIRAIREGVHKSGRSLIIMPSEIFHNLSDADAQAIVAYLRSQPTVMPDTPPNSLNVIGALFTAALPIFTVQQPSAQAIVAPPVGVSADYGKYLIGILGCQICHGANLADGGGGFGPPRSRTRRSTCRSGASQS